MNKVKQNGLNAMASKLIVFHLCVIASVTHSIIPKASGWQGCLKRWK